MNKIWTKLKSSKFSWALMVALFAVSGLIVAGVVASVFSEAVSTYLNREDVFDSAVLILFPSILLAYTLYIASRSAKREGEKVKDLIGLGAPNKKVWWLLPSVTIIYLVILVLVMAILQAVSPQVANQEQDVAKTISSLGGLKLAASAISVCLFTPFAEEFFFRGLIFNRFNKRLSIVISAVLTSVLFALAHGQLNVGLDTFFFGIALVLLRVQTKSIYPGVALHMAKNILAFSVILKK